MDYASLVINIGTILMIIPYVYFFILYRERFMGIWLLSWFLFWGRIVFFDYGPFAWKQSVAALTFFQFVVIINALTFIWGTYVFINKALHKQWLYVAAGILTLSVAANLLHLPLIYKLLPPLGFACFVCIWIGKIFTCHLKTKGIGNFIAGYALISWGLLTLFMPYSISIPWLSPWCYLMGIILRLIIVLGVLLVYLEKTRSDLAEKEAQYRLLAENAVDVIYRYRLVPAANFEYISPSALLITGYSPEEYYSDAGLLNKLIHPDDKPLFEKFFQAASSPGSLPFAFRLTRKDQSTIWIEQTSSPIYDHTGEIIALEGIMRDVTARKNTEDAIARIEQMNMVGQMAASVAHEIRNPLTSVRGYLQIMKTKGASWANEERLDLMISELDRTNLVLTEYLVLAKDKVPDFEFCCLNSIINAVFPLMQVTAAYHTQIKLCLGEIPKLHLDKNEIRQLLFNLVNNGLQAMSKGGELVISTYTDQDAVILSIRDQGPGIEADVLEKLGTPFLTTKPDGTGLGLPMCFRIAQRHNATIHVETSDQGTVFLIRFT